jgi:SAM-dependent methyltransferase
MKLLPRDVSGFSFVDIGSGKGRTLLLAARFPFRSVIGIEYAASLVQIANANVPNYRGNPPLQCAIESICADATTATYPETPLVIYFFNPFAIEIFEKVFGKIVDSYKAAPRPILLIYVSGEKSVLERVSDLVVGSNLFESQLEKRLPFYLDAPWRLRCEIFRTKEALG